MTRLEALQALAARLNAGEITKDQFEAMKAALMAEGVPGDDQPSGGKPPPPPPPPPSPPAPGSNANRRAAPPPNPPQAGYVTTGPAATDNYRIIGIVGVSVDNKDAQNVTPTGCQLGGCGGPTVVRVYVSIPETYQRGAKALLVRARSMGGDAVIHAQFEYRMAIETLGMGKQARTNQVFELMCVGTAVKIGS